MLYIQLNLFLLYPYNPYNLSALFLWTYGNSADPNQMPRHLIRVSTVCLQDVLFILNKTEKHQQQPLKCKWTGQID